METGSLLYTWTFDGISLTRVCAQARRFVLQEVIDKMQKYNFDIIEIYLDGEYIK
jgi:hypothetical protein